MICNSRSFWSIYLDQRVEHVGEVLVGVPVTGVDAAVLVVELDGAGDGLGQGEPARLYR